MSNDLACKDIQDVFEYIHITIPVYYTQTFKTKADKTFLVGMNWYRTAHYFIKNEVKKWFTHDIVRQLTSQQAATIKGPYELAFEYYYKNKTSDLGNVCGIASKHANDAFEAYGLVSNDNVQYCKKECYYVGGEDKENPRMEIYIRALPKEEDTDELHN